MDNPLDKIATILLELFTSEEVTAMFLRTKKFKNKDGSVREYIFIAESKWENGKIRQKTVGCLGRKDILIKNGEIDKLVTKLNTFTQKVKALDLAKDIEADWHKSYGIVLIMRHIWEKLGFGELFRKYLRRKKNKKNLVEAILALVINRLVAPSSELGVMGWKEKVYEPLWEKLTLSDFYRALDFLVENKEESEVEIFGKTANLFNQKLDLILFDTTSLRYWGEGKTDLLRYGYSKEKRGDLKQLIVGVLMTKEGMPVGHEVWPGNTSDLKSFMEILEKVKSKFQIEKVVWVCDRGMVSEDNLKEVQKAGHEYIVGIKMRQFSEAERGKFLGTDDMIKIHSELYVKEVKVKGKGRYIICYNPVEADYEKRKREFFKEVLRRKVAERTDKEWIMKNGYRKYIDIDSGVIKMNEERLAKEEIFDGKWVLLTNTELPSREVALCYKSLWQIEASFRDLKHELEANPIYHFTERRIRAHIFICFLALVLKLTFKKWVEKIANNLNYSKVIEAVKDIEAIQITTPHQRVILRTEFPPNAHFAFKAVGMSPPSQIIKIEQRYPHSAYV